MTAVSGVAIRSAGALVMALWYICRAPSTKPGSNFCCCGTFPCSRRTVIGRPTGWVHATYCKPMPAAYSAMTPPSANQRVRCVSSSRAPADNAASQPRPYEPMMGAKPPSGLVLWA
ncbi:hypothetical protein D3C72_1559400 [compost metagenome]